MPTFQKKAVRITAHRWFKNGDHPEDNCAELRDGEGLPLMGQGKVVRYYRRPICDGQRRCERCAHIMHEHGWIDVHLGGGGNIVCPGDWIITEGNGEYRPCKPDIFEASYDVVLGD